MPSIMTTIDSPPSSPKPTAPSGSVKGPFSPSTSVVTPPRENLSAPALSGKLRRNQSVGPCVNSAESGGDGNGAATHASSSVLNVSGNDLETSTISLGSSFRQRRRATSSGSLDLQAPLSDGDEATRPLFDLSASLYKRRGGMGWNADQNWILRWFTLHGSVLCYYDSVDADRADPSRPRNRINLAKEDTSVAMHLSNKAGAQTQFLVTINIYGIGGKRKWELCCKTQTQQLDWFNALRKYDGKPAGAFDLDGGGGERYTGSGVVGSSLSPQKRRKNNSNVSFTEDTTPYSLRRVSSTASENDIFATRADSNNSLWAILMNSLDGTVSTRLVFSVVTINFAAYWMRNGSHATFLIAILIANLVVLRPFMLTRHLHVAGIGTDVSTSPSNISPTFSEEEIVPFSTMLDAGSTLNRAKAVKPALVKELAELDMASARAIRACATASASDYQYDPHTFWNVHASLFNLRTGPNYKKNKLKAPSGSALYDLYAVDLVRANCRLKNVADGFNLPAIAGITDIDTGHPDVPPMIVVNAILPSEDPGLFKCEDGPSFIAVMYLTISKALLEELKELNKARPAVKLFVRWCQEAADDFEVRSRLKAMCVLDDIDNLGLPKFIAGFNGKPTLISRSGSFTRFAKYIEISINVHIFSYVAKKSLHSLQSRFSSFILNIGLTIEGRTDDDLPEVLLGGCRLINLDLNKAVYPGAD